MGIGRKQAFRTGATRIKDGNVSYRFGPSDEVYKNRRKYFEAEGLPPERLVTFFTEHKDVIVDPGDYDPSRDALKSEAIAICDAVITNTPGTGIFLTFADCVPFVLYDRSQHLLAFAHIGWRSMSMGFTAKLIRHMKDQYSCRAEDLDAVIGPSIKKESYVFDEAIQSQMPAWEPFLEKRKDGRIGIDLLGYCLKEVEEGGIAPANVEIYPVDTAVSPEYFSHYAATELGLAHKNGRFLFYAWLEAF